MSKFYYDSDELGYEIESVGAGHRACPASNNIAKQGGHREPPLQEKSLSDPQQKQISYSCDPTVTPRSATGLFDVDLDGDSRTTGDVVQGTLETTGEHAGHVRYSGSDGQIHYAPVPPPPAREGGTQGGRPPVPPPPARVATPTGVTVPRGFYVAQKPAAGLPQGAQEVPGHTDLMFMPNPPTHGGGGGHRAPAVVPAAPVRAPEDQFIIPTTSNADTTRVVGSGTRPAPVNPGAQTESANEVTLRGDLTRVFGGGAEGERMARAYINNPPSGMTRDAWIRSQYEAYHPSGGGQVNPQMQDGDVMKGRLERNMVANLQQRYQGLGAQADQARTTAESFRVSGDRDATLQSLMAENDRFDALQNAHATATAARPAGAGMTEEQWTNLVRSGGFVDQAGFPNRDLNPANLNAAVQREQSRGNNEDLLKANIRGVYPNTDAGRADADAFMASLPSDPDARAQQVQQELNRFRAGSTPPTVDELNRTARESLERRSTQALTGLDYNADQIRTMQGAATTPAQQRQLVERAEALRDARNNFIQRGGRPEDFRTFAQQKNWVAADGSMQSNLDPAAVRQSTERMRAMDSFRSMLAREHYSPEQQEIIMRNLRFPPNSVNGVTMGNADPAAIRAYEAEFARTPADQRNAAVLQLTQNNLVREYAAKMHVSEDVARLRLADQGILRQSQTIETVGREQNRVAGLTEPPAHPPRGHVATDAENRYREEARTLEQTTGATQRNPGGTQARMDQLRNRINPADRQYADQIATLDRQHAQEWETRRRAIEMEGHNAVELEDKRHQHALEQADRQGTINERLENIRHENALQLEKMRIKAQGIQTAIQFLGQMISAALQAMTGAHQASMQQMASVNQATFQGFKHG